MSPVPSGRTLCRSGPGISRASNGSSVPSEFHTSPHSSVSPHLETTTIVQVETHFNNKQECIPVGCVLPAAVVMGGGLPQRMLRYTPRVWVWRPLPWVWAWKPARHAGIPPTPRRTAARHAPENCCKACWDTTCSACWDTTLSLVNRILDARFLKIITLPQTSFAGGKYCYFLENEDIVNTK